MFDAPVLNRVCRESYNDPTEVYERLKRLGMSIVTITDHDSIDAVEALRRYPDFFLSEEVTVTMPSGTLMHLGVYGIGERDHAEIQRRRNDFIALLMYLTERKLFFSVNHVFSGLTGRRDEEDFRWFASYVPAFEVRNGQMWARANAGAEKLAKRLGKVGIAGSDSHTIAGVGRTYTEVAGARTAEEFLAGLRAGRGVICGAHGTYAKLTADVYPHRAGAAARSAMDAAADAAGRVCSGVHRGALAERNPLLPKVVSQAGQRGEAVTQALAVGYGPGGQFGGLTPWSADESK